MGDVVPAVAGVQPFGDEGGASSHVSRCAKMADCIHPWFPLRGRSALYSRALTTPLIRLPA